MLFWLFHENGKYISRISKMRDDLNNWQISDKPFLYPKNNEGINNSDVDLIAYKGKTYIFYHVGDQQSWFFLTYGTYQGNLNTFIKSYF
jgi:hypothetical protein